MKNRVIHRLSVGMVLLGLILGSQVVGKGKPSPPPTPLPEEKMGRLRTVGFEIALGVPELEGQATIFGGFSVDATFQTSVVRSGDSACRLNSDTGNGAIGLTYGRTTGIPSTLQEWNRLYFRFDNLPDSTVPIMRLNTSLGNACSAKLTSGGKLQLFNDNTGTQIGSDSAVTITTGEWYRVELHMKLGSSGADDDTELRLDGVTVASATGVQLLGSMPSSVTLQVGWVEQPGTSKVMYLDDLAINDDQGSDQNSWPGEGKIVLLRAISDNQVGSWTAGAGGTTNLFEAINNTPPIGTASETDLTQIERTANSPDDSTTEYRADMTAYLDAGITAADTVSLVQTVVDHGEDGNTGTKTGDILINSNPVQITADTFTYGEDVGPLGTWPDNWRVTWGTVQYSPSVTVGSSPVLRLRKTDSGGPSRTASVDFAGIVVEYVEAVVQGFASRFALLGVGP